jgi:hypothetical protein
MIVFGPSISGLIPYTPSFSKKDEHVEKEHKSSNALLIALKPQIS